LDGKTGLDPVFRLHAGTGKPVRAGADSCLELAEAVLTLRKRSLVTCFSAPIVDVYRYSFRPLVEELS
jgi:hypothetical protein